MSTAASQNTIDSIVFDAEGAPFTGDLLMRATAYFGEKFRSTQGIPLAECVVFMSTQRDAWLRAGHDLRLCRMGDSLDEKYPLLEHGGSVSPSDCGVSHQGSLFVRSKLIAPDEVLIVRPDGLRPEGFRLWVRNLRVAGLSIS